MSRQSSRSTLTGCNIGVREGLAVQRDHYNTVRLHAGIGYVTPDQEHRGERDAIRAARRAGLSRARAARITYHRNNRTGGSADAD